MGDVRRLGPALISEEQDLVATADEDILLHRREPWLMPGWVARLMSARCPHLPGVVLLSATFPVQHLPRELRALGVSLHDRMPAATVGTSDLRSNLKRGRFHPAELSLDSVTGKVMRSVWRIFTTGALSGSRQG
jgi:hypothetical protein